MYFVLKSKFDLDIIKVHIMTFQPTTITLLEYLTFWPLVTLNDLSWPPIQAWMTSNPSLNDLQSKLKWPPPPQQNVYNILLCGGCGWIGVGKVSASPVYPTYMVFIVCFTCTVLYVLHTLCCIFFMPCMVCFSHPDLCALENP